MKKELKPEYICFIDGVLSIFFGFYEKNL